MSSRRTITALMALLLGTTLLMAACAQPAEEPQEEPREETQTEETTATEDATITVSDQAGATTQITIDRAVAPEGGWIVVHLNNNGKPGPRIGLQQIQPGENVNVPVTLNTGGAGLTDELIAAVHMDTGVPGEFEFEPEKFEQRMEETTEGQEPDMADITDAPYFVEGMEVATMFRVK